MALKRESGIGNWSRFNPRLRGALSRGEQVYGGHSDPVPVAKQPPASGQMVQVHTDVHLDGKKVGRAVATHLADAHQFPRKAGGMDTHGSFRSPGTPVTDAA